jgi:hypothetical protein
MAPQDSISRWDGADGSERVNHPLFIGDLARDGIRGRVRQVWLDPCALNTERISASVSRACPAHLGALARAQKHPDEKNQYSAA